MNVLRLTGAEISYGERSVLANANLILDAGEKVALVGRNGAGKSTLLKVLAGATPLDDGHLWTADGMKVATLDQSVPDAGDKTVFEVVVGGLGELGSLLSEYRRIGQEDAQSRLDDLARIEASIETHGGWNVEPMVTRVLDRMKLSADRTMAECSGGLRRRAMLARAFVAQPDLLLLDEPTNHLDIESIDALQQMLQTTSATVVLVSHDRVLIDQVATRIVEINRGNLVSHPGSYAAYLERKAKAEADEAITERKFDRELAREEAWIRQGIKARRTRNEGRVRRLQELRSRRAARLSKQGNVQLGIDATNTSGSLVARLEHVSFGYDAPLIRDFSTQVMRGDRVGIIGANGSGKSTLLNLLLGELQPQSGTATLGTRLQIAYFDQQRSQLDESATVRDSVADGSEHIEVDGRRRHVVGYLADYLFPSSYMNMPVARLSGGEKNRLLLARLFAKPANLLVLDEPTNDLDVETLELLEELLGEFKGTLLLVSHDRAFLDAVVTSTIVFEADGTVREYVGGYTDWQRQRPAATDEVTRSSPEITVRPPASKTHSRLGYMEKRELAALPEQIEALEGQQAQLQQQVGNPEFYQQSREAVETALEELSRISAEIDAAYVKWEALSERDDAAGRG